MNQETTCIPLTREMLRQVMFDWEQSHRAGDCISYEEGLSMNVDDVADCNTDMLWQELLQIVEWRELLQTAEGKA